jgi:hypothetical protein
MKLLALETNLTVVEYVWDATCEAVELPLDHRPPMMLGNDAKKLTIAWKMPTIVEIIPPIMSSGAEKDRKTSILASSMVLVSKVGIKYFPKTALCSPLDT